MGAVFQVDLESQAQGGACSAPEGWNTRLSSWAKLRRARGDGRGVSPSAAGAFESIAVLGTPGTEGRSPTWRPEDGTISARSLALRPRRAKQAPPWAWLRARARHGSG